MITPFFSAQEEAGTMEPQILNTGTFGDAASQSNTTLASFDAMAGSRMVVVAWSIDRNSDDATVIASGATFNGNAMTLVESAYPTAGGSKLRLFFILVSNGETGAITVTHPNVTKRQLVCFSTDADSIDLGNSSISVASAIAAATSVTVSGIIDGLVIGACSFNNNLTSDITLTNGTVIVQRDLSGVDPYLGLSQQSANDGVNSVGFTTSGISQRSSVAGVTIFKAPITGPPILTIPYSNLINFFSDVVNVDLTGHIVGADSIDYSGFPATLSESADIVTGTVTLPTGRTRVSVTATNSFGSITEVFEWDTLTIGAASNINQTINSTLT